VSDGEREISPRGAILLGLLVAAVGIAIIAAAAWAPQKDVHAPRWLAVRSERDLVGEADLGRGDADQRTRA